MKTLDDLIKELGLTPSFVEWLFGTVSKNGVTFVHIFSDNTYMTLFPKHTVTKYFKDIVKVVLK